MIYWLFYPFKFILWLVNWYLTGFRSRSWTKVLPVGDLVKNKWGNFTLLSTVMVISEHLPRLGFNPLRHRVGRLSKRMLLRFLSTALHTYSHILLIYHKKFLSYWNVYQKNKQHANKHGIFWCNFSHTNGYILLTVSIKG